MQLGLGFSNHISRDAIKNRSYLDRDQHDQSDQNDQNYQSDQSGQRKILSCANCLSVCLFANLYFIELLMLLKSMSLLRGVQKNSSHFVFGDFSASFEARFLDIFQQPFPRRI